MENNRIIKYYLLPFIACCLLTTTLPAQQENTAIRKGNQLYKEGKFEEAMAAYQQAMDQNAQNPASRFNMGNVQFRRNDFAAAEQSFEQAIGLAGSNAMKQKAYYNKGVALSKQQKLEESIEAWKNALRMDPSDAEARFNLQKALNEQKKQNASKEQQQEQKQKPKEQQKPPPPQSKLDRRKIEQYLKSLQQKEQEIQRKIQENRSRSVSRPEKDW